ncbi:MAG: DUF3793 family protein [Candidatus Omnitrophica bacterium]|nr:DUF3793 family protein [Candidatus Omnitrophota bacterium]
MKVTPAVSEKTGKEAKIGISSMSYLMVRLAPVLVGLKPSSLFGFCKRREIEGESFYDQWAEDREKIAAALGVSFKELKDAPCGRQVLFYRPESLRRVIARPENRIFLGEFGYSSCRSPEEYLKLLKTRFNGRSFPHEIGIFLGYPLKDVKGFIHKGSMPLMARGRWQVFGEASGSMRLMRMHEKAERIFQSFIRNGRDPMVFLERVSSHFRKFSGDIVVV